MHLVISLTLTEDEAIPLINCNCFWTKQEGGRESCLCSLKWEARASGWKFGC